MLASHGALSKGMYDSVKMIAGENIVENVQTYSLLPGENALEFALQLQKEIAAHPEDEYVVICDVFGGSIYTALLKILTEENVVLFCGMNMTLVLEVLMMQDSTDDAWATLCETGKEGIKYFNKTNLPCDLESEDF